MMEEQKDDILSGYLKLFKWYGLHPLKGIAMNDKRFFLQYAFVILLYSFGTIGCGSLLFHMFYSGEHIIIKDALDSIVVFIAGIAMAIIITSFVTSLPSIKEIIKNISRAGVRYGTPDNMKTRNRHLELFGYFCCIYTIFTSMIYTSFGVLDSENCERQKIEFQVQKVCGMMMLTWMPFDIESTPNYQIYWFLQFIAGTALPSVAVLIIVFLFSINEMFLLRIRHWRKLFSRTFLTDDDKTQKEHLTMCIEYHIVILRLHTQINECFSTILFFFVSAGSPEISLISFTLLLEHELRAFLHLLGWLVCIFMGCFCGQRLLDESEKVTLDVYKSLWYKGNVSIQKDVLLILMRTQKLMVLDARGFCIVSLVKYSTILQNSYTMLALLNQTYNRDNAH